MAREKFLCRVPDEDERSLQKGISLFLLRLFRVIRDARKSDGQGLPCAESVLNSEVVWNSRSG